ncbi:MAG: hypothetical protein FWE80_01930 [Oscillospiraceae bacterium]|nr:hypothetical protein [Oscillospiraceae bacterium]
MSKEVNTAPDYFDDTDREDAISPEEILMNEGDLLAGLLSAGKGRDDEQNYRMIRIKRNGKLLFEFRVRPVTEEESQACLKNATKYSTNKPGQPKVAIDRDNALFRSHLIYGATVNEDRAKVWDNKKAQDGLGVLRGVDMIDKVLLAGEKNRVFEAIESISGYDEDAEELAGNS